MSHVQTLERDRGNSSRLTLPANGGRPIGALSCILFYWMAALATHFVWIGQRMHADYSLFLRVARDWFRGLPLYEHNYDNKSPIVFLWVKLVDSPYPEVSLYLAETLLAAIAGFFLFRALRCFHYAAGLAIPVLMITTAGMSPTFYGGQTTEAPAIWLGVISFSLLAASGSRRFVSSLAAGIAFFLMCGLYPPAAITGLALVPLIIEIALKQGQKHTIASCTGFLAGIGVSLAGFVIFAITNGFWDRFVEVLRLNAQYASFNRTPFSDSLKAFFKVAFQMFEQNQIIVVLICITSIFLWTGSLPSGKLVWLVAPALWLVAATIAVFPGGRHHPHYYHFLVVPLSFLAGLCVVPFCQPDVLPRWLRPALIGLVLACFLILLPRPGIYFANQLLRKPDHPGTTLRLVAEYLDRETSVDEPVLVCVWFGWAELYWRVPRPSLTRHAIPDNLPEIRPEFFVEWMEALFNRPPRYIVTDMRFEPPSDAHVAGEKVKEPWGGVEANKRLRDFFRDKYVVEREFNGSIKILRLKASRTKQVP